MDRSTGFDQFGLVEPGNLAIKVQYIAKRHGVDSKSSIFFTIIVLKQVSFGER